MRLILLPLTLLTFVACALAPEHSMDIQDQKKEASEKPTEPQAPKFLECKGTHFYNPVEVANVVVNIALMTKIQFASMAAEVRDLDDKLVEQAKQSLITGEPFDPRNPRRKNLNLFTFSSSTKKKAKISLILSPELVGTGYYIRELSDDPLAVKLTCAYVKVPSF